MTIAIRANDLRTTSGRSSGERKALKALRRAYINAHPEMTPEAICDEFRRQLWVSKKTYKQDVIRFIKYYRTHHDR